MRYRRKKTHKGKTFLAIGLLAVPLLFSFFSGPDLPALAIPVVHAHQGYSTSHIINDTIKRDEAFSHIFKRNDLSLSELHFIDLATKETHKLSRLSLGQPYSIKVDDQGSVSFMTYQIDDSMNLNIVRTADGYASHLIPIEYERRTRALSGTIKDNLVSAIESDLLAMEMSDIFAWDIDFTTDLRKGDTFKLAVEELWREGKRVRYGNILAAEFVNNGHTIKAYLFDDGSGPEYFDATGQSLRKALLKAPLSYRRISSGFTNRRYHPILKKYRPHYGVDYSARLGTPVSSVGDGVIKFAGRKGPNGKLVIIKHSGGYTTYYGHLHRISKGIKRGARVRQGQVIGKVGKTGRATGPHLDYRVKRNGKFVNPLKLKPPRSTPIADTQMGAFLNSTATMDRAFINAPNNSPVAMGTTSQ